MKDYRKIWESYYGKIPIDELGRSYDIHHIDGNRNNNDISNLKAVSLQEHYEIHISQKEYDAANLIAQRLGLAMYSGYKRPDHSKKMSGKGNPMYGKKGKHSPHYGKKRPNHSMAISLWWKNNPNYDRGEEWRKNISKAKIGKVICKNKNGETLFVTKEQFYSDPNLISIVANNKRPTRYKKIRCIEDNIIFESIQAACKYYGGLSGIVDNLKGRKYNIGIKKLGRGLNFEYL